MYKSFHNPELTKRLTVAVSRELGEAYIHLEPDKIKNPSLRVQVFDSKKFQPVLQRKEVRCSSGTITPDCLDDVSVMNIAYELVKSWWSKGISEKDIINGVSTLFTDYEENI